MDRFETFKDTINVWSCMEIFPIHSGAEYVKVNYYRCMRKIIMTSTEAG